MSVSILVTGSAGYIGGSLVQELLHSHGRLIKKESIIAPVRSQEQEDAVSKLGVKVARVDLSDENAVLDLVVHNNVTIVIHTASSMDLGVILPLIKALGEHKKTSGQETYMIHTSGTGAFTTIAGWPESDFPDTGPVFEKEKELRESFPIRQADVTFLEVAGNLGVTTFIVVPPIVYGRGNGPYNQLSVVLPVLLDAAIREKAIWRFSEDNEIPGVHISDLSALYALLVEHIMFKRPLQSGKQGYYFAFAHSIRWHQTIDALAGAMKSRGILENTDSVRTWPNNQVAAETLETPEAFVPFLWNSWTDIKADRVFKTGWKPQWNRERFLENVDDEITAVLELGKAKSSLVDSMRKAAKG